MSEKESPFKVSPPVQKELQIDSAKRTVGKELRKDKEKSKKKVKKRASELIKKAEVNLGISDMKSDYWEKQKKIAKKETLAKKREAFGKRLKSDEAKFAYLAAFNPDFSKTIEGIIGTGEKKLINIPSTWSNVIHKELMKDKRYVVLYNEYKKAKEVSPPPEAPPVAKRAPKRTPKRTPEKKEGVFTFADLKPLQADAFREALGLYPKSNVSDPKKQAQLNAYIALHYELGRNFEDKYAWHDTIEKYAVYKTVKMFKKGWETVANLPVDAFKKATKRHNNLKEYVANLGLKKDQKESFIKAILEDDLTFDINKSGKKKFIEECLKVHEDNLGKVSFINDKEAWLASISDVMEAKATPPERYTKAPKPKKLEKSKKGNGQSKA